MVVIMLLSDEVAYCGLHLCRRIERMLFKCKGRGFHSRVGEGFIFLRDLTPHRWTLIP